MKFFNYFQIYSCVNFKSNDRVIKSRKKVNENAVNEHNNKENQNNSRINGGNSLIFGGIQILNFLNGGNQANKYSTWMNEIRHNKFSFWVYYFILNN